MDQLVPIGHFSELTRLSIKALRHYDKLGLLPPAEIDASSGYRYYRLSQAGRANAIRTLRGLDMPLEDIEQVLAAEGEERAKRLAEHRDRLATASAQAQRRLDEIDRLIAGDAPVVPYTVERRDIGDQVVAGLRRDVTFESVGDAIGEGFGIVFGALMAAGAGPDGAPFLVMHDVIDAETPGEIEICIPIAETLDLAAPTICRRIGGGAVAVTTHQGPYHDVAGAYHALAGWMIDEAHEPAGPPREIYLNDPTQVAEADLLTEVQWPIRPA